MTVKATETTFCWYRVKKFTGHVYLYLHHHIGRSYRRVRTSICDNCTTFDWKYSLHNTTFICRTGFTSIVQEEGSLIIFSNQERREGSRVDWKGLAFLHNRRYFLGQFKGLWCFKLQNPVSTIRENKKWRLFYVVCATKTSKARHESSLLSIPKAVFRIHEILGWIRIRIRGSMPLTSGSGSGFGSGSCYFRTWPSRCQQKTNFWLNFFCLLLFEGTFTSFFKDKK